MYFQGFLPQICPLALHSGYLQEHMFLQNAISDSLFQLHPGIDSSVQPRLNLGFSWVLKPS